MHMFRRCVTKYQSNYNVRTFSCLDQFLCMAFAQLTYRESLLATMLRLNLFTYRDLMTWLKDPFGQPPLPPVIQLRLPGFGQPVAGIK